MKSEAVNGLRKHPDRGDSGRWWWSAALTLLLSALVGWLGWRCAAPPDPAEFAALAAAFPEWAQPFLRPEPRERAAVLAMVLALPAVWLLAGRWVAAGGRRLDRWGWLPAGALSLAALGIIAGGTTCRNLLIAPGAAGLAAMAVAAVWFGWPERRTGNRRRLPAWVVWTGAAGVIGLQIFTTRIYFPEYVYYVDRGHFGLLSQTIVNTCNGLAAPSQYGYFAWFLLPFFRWFGHSVVAISLLMGGLLLLGVGSLTFLWLKTVRCRRLIVPALGGFTLVLGSYISMRVGDFDPYFQYHPIRSLGPMLAALWVYGVSRGGSRHGLAAAGGLLAAGGVFWNVDAGVVTALAMAGFLGWRAYCRRDRGTVMLAAETAGWTAAGLAACVAFFDLELTAGLFQYQRLFFLSGYYLLPMPGGPHLWQVVLGGYFVLWGWGARQMFRCPENRTAGLLFFMATLGIGLFFYYQGRSVDGNLIAISWPLYWSAVVLLDRMRRSRASGPADRRQWPLLGLLIAVPAMLAGSWAADLPATFRLCRQVAERWEDRRAQYDEDFAFIRRIAPADGVANLVGAGQGFFAAETGLAPGFLPFNQMELITRADYRRFLEGLAASGRPLILTPRKFVYDWEPPAAFLADYFELKAVSPSGRIRVYLPRRNGPEATSLSGPATR